MLRSVIFVQSLRIFAPSPYDFRVDPEDTAYEGHSGFLKKHFYVPDKNHFGELSLMSLNAHIDRDTLEAPQEKDILGLIDIHHPSIFALQGLAQSEARRLAGALQDSAGHYEVACTEATFFDVWANKIELLPILYDRHSVVKIREYIFQPVDYANQAYGCMGVFYSKLTEQIFSVINVDLPSIDEGLVNAQIFNILEHLRTSDVKDYPLFITGTVNRVSDRLKLLIDRNFINLNVADKNNVGLNKTTFHRHGLSNDNIQRDFILLKDMTNKFQVNYSRTLSRYPKEDFEHFPNYAILSRKNIKK